MGPLLVIFPHPDDETFTAAGVLAAAVERGVPVTVVSTTRGEAGESSLPGLEDPERLGLVREGELRDAMRHLGVGDVRVLGYRDSGMEGSPFAADPRAFVRASVEDVAARIVPLIRTIRPHVVITFGPEGGYGHPDHVHLHYAVLAAIRAAGQVDNPRGDAEPWQTPRLYYAAFPREQMLAALDRPNSPLASLSPQARANLGVPMEQISHVVDIAPWASAKRAAIVAHRTQTGEGGPLAQIPPEVTQLQLTREYFVRAPLPWSAIDDCQDIIEALATERSSAP